MCARCTTRILTALSLQENNKHLPLQIAVEIHDWRPGVSMSWLKMCFAYVFLVRCRCKLNEASTGIHLLQL